MQSIELCAGAGGQALGLEQAGFHHALLVENDAHACSTLRHNRPEWDVKEEDLKSFDPSTLEHVDLLAGGLPCPPFSVAGKKLGHEDERNLFPEAEAIIDHVRPKAVMIENVKGILEAGFLEFREAFLGPLKKMGYVADWKLVQSADYGVPQLRPRAVLVAVQHPYAGQFRWPKPQPSRKTVGDALFKEVASNGWTKAEQWALKAAMIAPTIVGGSKKHGGPDLGPTRAKKAWLEFDVDGKGIGNAPPNPDHEGPIRLTNRMVASLQGFPDDWHFVGGKTAVYRQIGNAFPPPVAHAIALQIYNVLEASPVMIRI